MAAGLLAVALACAWQASTVRANYGGNWTALFCTGERYRAPPELAGERIHVFAGSGGYDGQFYHYMAHDPLRTRGLDKYVDLPRLRYRRILLPLSAYLLAGGRDGFVDAAYRGVILLWVLLGAYWLSRYACSAGRSPAWGLGFLLVPAVIISLDRLVVDVALAALVLAFALYTKEGPPWKLYLVLLCATLTRETGVLPLAGYCLHLLLRREARQALLYATAALPAAAWFGYLQFRVDGDMVRPFVHSARGLAGMESHAPMRLRLGTPEYQLPDALAGALTLLDYLSLLGIALAVLLAARFVWNRERGPREVAALLFAVLAVWMSLLFSHRDPYAYPRVVSPLLVLVALRALDGGGRLALLPAALVALRVAGQLAPQAAGIARALLHELGV
ncbi:MAG: hypothetical protein HY858_02875 [Candidatus Solibacter usitatus]|nr:hypothetical protein [Candidatus Solibacter usitatus]